MTFTRLVRLAAVGALFTLAAQAVSAQTTTMETRQGSRHTGPGTVAASSSTFAVGITKDNGATYVSTASVSETVQICGEVKPEAANVGQSGDIFLVDRVIDSNGGHVSFSMRDQSGVWLPWNGTVSLLQPFLDNTTLQATMPLTLFSGTLGTAGTHRIFIGYMSNNDNILRYHTSGLPLTITAAQTQTPSQQAFARFQASTHAQIVQGICTACHVEGGLGQSAGHIFQVGSSASVVQANYNVWLGLKSRGKASLMTLLTSSSTTHGGGQVVQGSQAVAELDAFLTLLTAF
jgi:hypothetical protein